MKLHLKLPVKTGSKKDILSNELTTAAVHFAWIDGQINLVEHFDARKGFFNCIDRCSC